MRSDSSPFAGPDAFAPHQWLANPHLQTVLSNLPGDRRVARPVVQEAFEISLHNSPDRLLAVGHWQPHRAPVITVLHGVGGSADASYVLQAVQAVLKKGFHAVALNFRGVGAGAALAQKLYHSGLISDLEAALVAIKERTKTQQLGMLGFSLGGQKALRLASTWTQSGQAEAQALATISAPFDLRASCEQLDRGPFWPYRRHIIRGLVKNCTRSGPGGPRPLPVPLQQLVPLKSLRTYDDWVTAPMHGFDSALDYYEEASCGPRLKDICLPALAIHAIDDPVVSVASLEPHRKTASSKVHCLWTPRGGHVGFISAWRHLKTSWAIETSLNFLAQNFH